MPLLPGKKSMGHNIKVEMAAGKPQRQSIAIAYSMAKKRKKMAEGGRVEGEHQSACTEHCEMPCLVHEQSNMDLSHPSAMEKMNGRAQLEDDRDLNQHGEHESDAMGSMDDNEPSPHNDLMGDPEHDSEHQNEEHEMDMVGRIMKQRAMKFSEGGRVANGGEEMLSNKADGRPNEFDDLALDDDLSMSDTAANSGDELGNEREDNDRDDMVARIMRSRALKDRLPKIR